MASKVLVVGSGVIGLRTALELIRKKIHVCVVSPRHPLHPSTCSMGAGGLWMPFHCDDERTDRWSFETLSELTETSARPGSLVEIVPKVSFQRSDNFPIPSWATDPKSKDIAFQTLTLDDLYTKSKSEKFRLPPKVDIEGAGYTHAWTFQAPIVDSPRMLTQMLEEVTGSKYTDHINVETNKYYSTIGEMVEEATRLGCDGLVNCTGLGAKQICGDESMVGARGVLLHFDRGSVVWREQQGSVSQGEGIKESAVTVQEEPYGTETLPCYIIPRGSIIAVGGTYLEGDEECHIRISERERVTENAIRMGIDVDKSKPISTWVGFRPYRPTCRLEVDDTISPTSGVKVVHSYGYGGSGWTVFVGAARDAALLLTQSS
ncbi:hypothetical protein ACHAWF_010761 [Thalassiosira exigua]